MLGQVVTISINDTSAMMAIEIEQTQIQITIDDPRGEFPVELDPVALATQGVIILNKKDINQCQ